MNPSDRIGALPGLGFIWNQGPFMALIYGIMASWLAMHVVAFVLEWRILVPSQQYASFYKGDLLGLPVMLAAIAPMIPAMPDSGSHWYQSIWWHMSVLAFGLIVGIGFKAKEYQDGAYTLRQVLSPTAIYHNAVVFPVMIYWIVACGIPALIYSRLGVRGLWQGNLLAPVLMMVLAAALFYWTRLLMADLKTDEATAAAKRAHVVVQPTELVFGLLGLTLVLWAAWAFQPWQQSRPVWLTWLAVAAFVVATAFYLTTFAHDAGGGGGVKPWAHVNYHWHWANPLNWRQPGGRPPWPYWTGHLVAPPSPPPLSSPLP